MKLKFKTKRAKYFLPIFAFIFVLTGLFVISPQLQAYKGASLTLSTESQLNSEDVELKLSGELPADIYAYQIRINYNPEAFDYVSTSFENFSNISYKDSVDGKILLLEAESTGGYIPNGTVDLLRIQLRAKAPGVSTILIASSTFYTANGDAISGSMLKYYTLEVNYSEAGVEPGKADNKASDNLPAPSEVEASNDSIISSLDSTASRESSTQATTADIGLENSLSETESLTADDLSINNSSTEQDYHRDYSHNLLYILIALIVIIILCLSILIVKYSKGAKQKDNAKENSHESKHD